MDPRLNIIFKACPYCRATWRSLAGFLQDPSVEFLGFQPGMVSHASGIFLFGHRLCATTMAIPMVNIEHLGQPPMFRISSCSLGLKNEFCLRDPRQPCPPECICQFVSGIISIIRNWPKDALPTKPPPSPGAPADRPPGDEPRTT